MEGGVWDAYVQNVNRIMLFPSCMDILLQKLLRLQKKAGTGETAVGSFALSVVGMVIKKK